MIKHYLPKTPNYNKLLKAIEKETSKIQGLPDLYAFRKGFYDRNQSATTKEERDAIHADFIKASEERDAIKKENEKIKIKIAILNHNAKHAFMADVLPYIKETLTRYAGKQYGPKTKDAITNELKKVLNCAVYLYEKKITIIPLDENGFSHCTNFELFATDADRVLTDENKINDINELNFSLYIGAPVDNINGRIQELYKAYEKARDAYEIYSNCLDVYNALTVNGIPEINKSNPHFYGII